MLGVRGQADLDHYESRLKLVLGPEGYRDALDLLTEAAVDAVFASIAEALARGEKVAVAGFGRFARTDRPAPEGRNPRTGERIAIGPSSGVSFKAAKALKDALN